MTLLVRRIVVATGIALLLVTTVIAVAHAPETIDARPLGATAVTADPAAADPAAGNTRSSGTSADAEIALELDAILAADKAGAAADRGTGRGKLRRLAAWDQLVHATVIVNLKEGGLTTIQLDHGTISDVSATSLTVAEAGGGTTTLTLNGETRVRRDGAKAAIPALKTGDQVFVMSKVEAAGTSAYLVVVPRR